MWQKQNLFPYKTFAFMAFVSTVLIPTVEDGRKKHFGGGGNMKRKRFGSS